MDDSAYRHSYVPAWWVFAGVAIFLTGCPERTDEAAPEPDRPVGVRVVAAFPHLTFDWPLYVTHPGDETDRLFVVEQPGRIYWFENRRDATEKYLALDLTRKVRSPRPPQENGQEEEGLLGLAFHPDFKENGHIFVHYSSADGPRRSVISRFTMNDERTVVDVKSEEVVLEVRQPQGNHNGGMLAFGPDGYLYLSFGDGGGLGDWTSPQVLRAIAAYLRGRQGDPHNQSQNLETLLGAILRIDVDRPAEGFAYSVPADNPFADRDDARGEIWAYGLRNPWRFSFDRETGDLWAGQVGEDDWEAIYLVTKGANHGWPYIQASYEFNGIPDDVDPADLTLPVVEHPHPEMQSIMGGYVYRGERLPQLQGYYIYGDYVTGRIWRFRYEDGEVADHEEFAYLGDITSFGEDRDGEVYICSFDGRIYTFAPAE
jgi:glucose/arabinose dehydrogenase